MIKVGLVQTKSFTSNQQGIKLVSKILESLGKKETDVVCLPEQWLKNNRLDNFETEFKSFKKIAKKYSMTIIPGAFYERKSNRFAITAPVIGPTGEIIGRQEKIHPFDYERNIVQPGKQAKVFKTKCKFGIIICYDMVFPKVANSLVKKGAEVLLSPSRIVSRGILPWHLYVQTRALENRIPILAANVENRKFGGQSIIVDLVENQRVMIPKITKLKGQKSSVKQFKLSKYKKSRKIRFSDSKLFT